MVIADANMLIVKGNVLIVNAIMLIAEGNQSIADVKHLVGERNVLTSPVIQLTSEANVLTSHAKQPTSEVKEPANDVYKITSPPDPSGGLAKHLIVIPKQLTSLAIQLTVAGDVFASLQSKSTCNYNELKLLNGNDIK